MSNVSEILDRIDEASFAMDAVAIAAGAQDLLDAASRSLSDGDEVWSHTELNLVGGDLDGAEAAIDALRPVLSQEAPDLLAEVDNRTAQLRDALGDSSTRELATRVDALATTLSRVRTLIAAGMASGNARIEP